MNSRILVFSCIILFTIHPHEYALAHVTCHPQNITNGNVSYNRPQEYPQDTIVSFTCHYGYALSGFHTRTCEASGNWNRELPQCRLITCRFIPLNNGTVSYNIPSGSPSPLLDTVATFSCNTNYYRDGPSSAKCQTSGGWSQRTPTCRLILCPSFTTVANGDVTITPGFRGVRRAVGSVVTISCIKGYIPFASTSTCGLDGNWSPRIRCDRETCAPRAPGNGYATYDQSPVNGRYLFGTQATYFCNSGYSRRGFQSAECVGQDEWSRPNPSCKKKSIGCFPANTKIKLGNGQIVMMSDLQKGDKVQTVSANGNVQYRDVETFAKKDPNAVVKYLLITTVCNKTLTLSLNHLLYARKHDSDKFVPIYADEISVGDEVLADSNNEAIHTQVINVSSLFLQGAYFPLTKEGNIIVDGILASCYASSVDHNLAHISVAPMIWFPNIIQMVFGGDDATSAFITLNEKLGLWILPFGQLW